LKAADSTRQAPPDAGDRARGVLLAAAVSPKALGTACFPFSVADSAIKCFEMI
jgi:hypothetical protein